jgi:uncharacterized protein YxjI
MANYYVRQKLLAAGNDFEVFDGNGNQLYYFDGKVFSIGSKTLILDNHNQEIGRIKRKIFAIRPTFTVSDKAGVIAKISKKILTFRRSFFIDVPGPDDITVIGSFLEHNYDFHRNGQKIASVQKKWFKGADSYDVQVSNTNDALLILSSVVVIDTVCHPKRDSNFKNSKQ